MEIKSIDKNNADYSSSTPKADTKDRGSFLETLDDVSKSYINIKKNIKNGIKTGIPIIDNLLSEDRSGAFDGINKLDKIFSIDILGDPDKFIRKDNTINMPRIISEYGNNVKSRDFDDLTGAINKLHDSGLITDEDYFYTLKWIATQKEAIRIKMNNEKIADNLVNHNNINNLNKNKLFL